MKKLSFRSRINLGFIIVFSILIFTTLYSIWQLNTIVKSLELVYNHPFKVSNSIRQVQIEIYKTAQLVRDIHFVDTKPQLDSLVDEINNCDRQININTKVIYNLYLGNKSDVDNLSQLYEDWNSIKKTMFRLKSENKTDSLEWILKFKNHQHVNHIIYHAKIIADFAENKAKTQITNTIASKNKTLTTLLVVLILASILAFIISHFISKSINSPIRKFISDAGFIFTQQTQTSHLKFHDEEELFNYTIKELQHAYQNIEQQNEEIKSSNEQLSNFNLILENKVNQRTLELKDSEENYRLLYTSMNQGLALHEIITDNNNNPINYRFININDSYTTLLGITREMCIGKTIKEVMPDTEQYWIDTFGKVALTEEPCYYENFLKTTGKYYATYSYCPKKNFFAVLVSDITERKMAEEKILMKNQELAASEEEIRAANEELITTTDVLKQTNDELNIAMNKVEKIGKQYMQLFEHLTVGFALHEIICDKNNHPVDYIFLDINPAFERITGLKASELIGKRVLEIMPNTELHWIETYGKVALTGEHIEFEDFSQELNKYFNVHAYSSQFKQFAVIIDDISFRKNSEHLLKEKNNEIEIQNEEYRQLNEELKQAKEKAEESDRLKSSFLQNMSHEVRTPLNAISGFSQLIIKPKQPQKKLELFAEIIASSSEQLVGIITDVIEISQIHANQIKIKSSTIDLISTIKMIINHFEKKTREKNIDLVFTNEIQLSEYLFLTDREKLERIISHLIDNGIKFTPKGKIEITCKLNQDSVLICIADTGIGITEAMQKIIFDPFRQVESGVCRNYGGNGLGLTIAKAYTELLNGTISVYSKEKAGTTFTLSFPLQNLELQKIEQKIEQKNYFVHTILIAEDQYSNYQYLYEMLEQLPIKILYAANGQQAVDMCKDNEWINLILMDIKMPEIDGYTAAKMIKEFRPDLPIIAQTAYAMESEKEDYNLVFDDYITKPIKEKDLKAKLAKYFQEA